MLLLEGVCDMFQIAFLQHHNCFVILKYKKHGI